MFKSHVCNISAFTLCLTTCIEKDRGLCIFIIIFLLLKFYLPCDDRVTYVNQKQETKIKPVEERWMQIARVTRVKNKILIWAIKKSLLLQIVTSFKRVSMGRAFTVTVWNLGHFTAKAEFLSVAFILRSTPFTPLKNLQISASLFILNMSGFREIEYKWISFF